MSNANNSTCLILCLCPSFLCFMYFSIFFFSLSFFPMFLFLSLSFRLFLPERTQLYQQYNEAAQNLEILSQSGSASHPVAEDSTQSPAPSPPPARRPLPALPTVLHPHSLFHSSSTTSAKSLPLPEPPRREGRPSSPRLSTSLTQSPTLWRDLPGVRNNHELAELTEDQRRLQEVTYYNANVQVCFPFDDIYFFELRWFVPFNFPVNEWANLYTFPIKISPVTIVVFTSSCLFTSFK